MAVVVNEVEVVPAERATEKAEQAQGGGEQPPSEHEIRRVVEHQMSRCERVWAY